MLAPERDVVIAGQRPVVDVYADRGAGEYRETDAFELRSVDGAPVARTCDKAWGPDGSRGFATLSFECQRPAGAGLFSVGFVPSRVGLSGPPVEIRLRVLKEIPRTPPPPKGWVMASLAARLPSGCYPFGESYEARVEGGRLELAVANRGSARIPAPLVARMSAAHASVVDYVFEDGEGWIVMFNHGEFGGGVEWYARGGGAPRDIVIGKSGDDGDVQNVNRAMALDGALFVLQGLSHMSISSGQLAVLWREHAHFTSQVIARYPSEPVDWVLEADGRWLVATREAIWRTSRSGQVELVVRLPDVLEYPSSLVKTADGTLYVGGRDGVLRLTPMWKEDPRYATDMLMPIGTRWQKCWFGEMARKKQGRSR
jgi:hypothetical protein